MQQRFDARVSASVWHRGRHSADARRGYRYGLHDTFKCKENRAARTMCVIPWDTDGPAVAAPTGTRGMDSRPWRLLTGHDSGNVLVFDPGLPHFRPILTIHFETFTNVAPKNICVLETLGVLCITRIDGTVQLLSNLAPRSHWMNNALDPMNPVRRPASCATRPPRCLGGHMGPSVPASSMYHACCSHDGRTLAHLP